MKIKFSKKNKNVLYVDDGIITLPPNTNGCDISLILKDWLF